MQQPSSKKRPSSAHVPAAPFVRRLIAHVNEEVMAITGEPYQGTAEEGSLIESLRVPHPLTVLLEKVWPDSDPESAKRVFYRLRHEADWVHFDVADRILCVLHQNDHWNIDPELAEIMEGVNLLVVDINRPTCDEAFREAIDTVRVHVGTHGVNRTARDLGISRHTVMGVARSMRDTVLVAA